MFLKINTNKVQFVIKNNSTKKLEWEILKGVIVIDERENIAPGFIQKLTTYLDTGEYEMTCGLLSNPKGKLVVENQKNINEINILNNTKFEELVLEYKKYVIQEVTLLILKTKQFTDAIKSGNLENAKKLFAPTRQHYERIEPIAEIFFDLDKKIDAREEDYEKKSEDPNFRGFHRIEKAIFYEKSTQSVLKYADFLYNDILDLKKSILKLNFLPNKIINGAAILIEEIAFNKISGEENRYSKTDLWDFYANIEGSEKIVSLIHPFMLKKNPSLLKKVEKNFEKAKNILTKYKMKNGTYKSYDKLIFEDRMLLQSIITFLAEDLALFRGVLELD